jgi:transposase
MDTNTTGGEVKAVVPAGKRRAYRSHSLEEKRRIVLECLTSGESVSIIARRHDMNANQLFHWRKQHARGQLGPMMLPSAPLLAVRVEESSAVERPSARSAAPVPEASWIEIECTRPYRVRVHGGVDRAALMNVLEILSAR